MFQSADGFFHFVFANQNDTYISPQYLKMEFSSYLRFLLLQQGYKNLYCFSEDSHGFQMWAVGHKLEQALPKKKFLGGLFGKEKNEPKPNGQFDLRFSILQQDTLCSVLTQIFDELMTAPTDTAVCMPLELFAELDNSLYDGFRAKLSSLRSNRKSKKNIFVLTSSVLAADNDSFFLNRSLMYPVVKSSQTEKTPLFFDKTIFPEIEEAFCDKSKFYPYRLMHYKKLREVLGQRMQLWNSLSYEQIRRGIQYKAMHEPDAFADAFYQLPDPVENCTAVLWLWYHEKYQGFRQSCPALDLPDNPQRKLSDLLHALDDKQVQDALIQTAYEKIANAETNPEEQYPEASAGCICNTQDHEDAGFISVLQRFRNILAQILKVNPASSNEQTKVNYENLLTIISEFQQPAFLFVTNRSAPAYRNFQNEEIKQITDGLFDYLEKQINNHAWNFWDNGASIIFFVLIQQCYENARELYSLLGKNTASADPFHSYYETAVHEMLFVLQYFQEQSKKVPFQEEEAIQETNRCLKALNEAIRNKDRLKLKIYRKDLTDRDY